jgi:hypothetical protein
MRYGWAAVAALVWAAAAAAEPVLAQGLGAGPRLGEIYYAEIQGVSPRDLNRLADLNLDIVNVRSGVATIYATRAELDFVARTGFMYSVVGVERPGKAARLEGGTALGAYHSYDTLTQALEDYAASYPDICRLYSIGQSVQGRELWVLFISDNPDAEEDEPEFKYTSTMHGNEPLGTELCLYLIDLLVSGYGSDSRVTALINDTALSFLPLHNPDGLELGTRANANGYDLNRSFPMYPEDFTGTIYDGEALDDAGRPLEVVHVMRWIAANSFAHGANFHTGSLVVNYPYDDGGVPSGYDAPTPDDLLFEEVSRRYSVHNLPMWNNPGFEDGITNGSAWYCIRGGMQDWNYRYASCNDVTIELSNTFRPAVSQLPTYWEDNRESMLAYLESVHRGVRGIVRDRLTLEPLYVKVAVEGNDHPVFTDPDMGDYHRMMLPGRYTLIVSADGYQTLTVANVELTEGPAARADVTLVPEGTVIPDVNNDGKVNAVDVQLVIVGFLIPPAPDYADVNGDGQVDAVDIQLVINAVLGIL